MKITKEMIIESKKLNEGTTCYIMQYKGSIVFKLYKEAIEYIFNNGKYNLEESWTMERLTYIVSKKNDVILTDLPNEILTYNGKPVGVLINYYKESISLNDYLLTNNSENVLRSVRKQILIIVNELINHGIIPTDPHFDNFVVCFNDNGTCTLKMIDTDDQYISIYPNNKRDVWYQSQLSACYRVIDLSFDNLKNNIKK